MRSKHNISTVANDHAGFVDPWLSQQCTATSSGESPQCSSGLLIHPITLAHVSLVVSDARWPVLLRLGVFGDLDVSSGWAKTVHDLGACTGGPTGV